MIAVKSGKSGSTFSIASTKISVPLLGRIRPKTPIPYRPGRPDSLHTDCLSSGGEKRSIPYAQIRRLEFSGKDAAAGKTWENWVRRYVEKHLAGERASIESESLD